MKTLIASTVGLGMLGIAAANAEPLNLSNAQMDSIAAGALTSTTSTVKIKGPTDAVVTTVTNGGGNTPVGQQSVELVPNRLAK